MILAEPLRHFASIWANKRNRTHSPQDVGQGEHCRAVGAATRGQRTIQGSFYGRTDRGRGIDNGGVSDVGIGRQRQFAPDFFTKFRQVRPKNRLPAQAADYCRFKYSNYYLVPPAESPQVPKKLKTLRSPPAMIPAWSSIHDFHTESEYDLLPGGRGRGGGDSGII